MKYKILFCMFLTTLVLVSFVIAEEPKIINPNFTCIEPDCIIINPPEDPKPPIYFINITPDTTPQLFQMYKLIG